eukprot:CAMPEP_0201480292 /NCGR_PEP_ID=MMETSP0151_2-20130828/4800_1 /ASSEMBLY_ACC=CAM_ASM_000257 /TAXON_ID=200890 /ORGANISM="Paramoeba atlantica, Strain 621/1 / CCAP 1560/9" /LENGTH=263 /DNA_ID=CAMNT_0047862095 /DNA_START=72 /DNA_END=860 /DNA_ORIENTATION=+
MIHTTFLDTDSLVSPPRKRRMTGKVSLSIMPNEIRLHRFVQKIKNRPRSWKPGVDVCKWKGVICIGENITELHWNNLDLRGNVTWDAIPESVENLLIGKDLYGLDKLRGGFDMKLLPAVLNSLDMNEHAFAGLVDFSHAPREMKFFVAAGNSLHGPLDLTLMPCTMEHAELQRNLFVGTLDLTKLPSVLELLHLGDNCFAGNVDVSKLPDSILEIGLYRNRLQGEIDVRDLPDGLQKLEFNGNNVTFKENFKPPNVFFDPVDD